MKNENLKIFIRTIFSTCLFVIICLNQAVAFQNNTTPKNDDHSPSISPDGKQVLFHSFREGFSNIYIMNSDGSSQKKITIGGQHDQFPKWAPDGSKIVFQSNRNGNTQIFLMNPDGSDQHPITNSSFNSLSASWSPDSDNILYISNSNGSKQIWKINPEDLNPIQISQSLDDKSNPAYSPDGIKIIYTSNKSGSQEIYIINSDGSEEKKLTNVTSEKGVKFITGLGWMPDGDRIFFTSNINKTGILYWNPTIYTIKPDGSDMKTMFDNVMQYFYPVWSKDGKIIYSDTYLYGGIEIISMNSDGSNIKNLTKTSSQNFYPKWADGGTKIVYTSQVDGDMEIYIMEKDGSNPKNLTKNKYRDGRPSVSLDGKTIVFVSYRTSSFGNLYTMDLNGNNLKKITNDIQFSELDLFPINTTFTPDGGEIIFELVPVWDSKRWDLYSIDIDGKKIKKLTNTPDNKISQYPQVSKDGKYIIYHTNIDGDSEIYRMDIDGNNPVNLTKNTTFDNNAVWAQDGEKVIYKAVKDGRVNLYQMNNDGTEISLFLENSPVGDSFAISGDGESIIFTSTSTKDYNTEIYIMNKKGENVKRITGKFKN